MEISSEAGSRQTFRWRPAALAIDQDGIFFAECAARCGIAGRNLENVGRPPLALEFHVQVGNQFAKGEVVTFSPADTTTRDGQAADFEPDDSSHQSACKPYVNLIVFGYSTVGTMRSIEQRHVAIRSHRRPLESAVGAVPESACPAPGRGSGGHSAFPKFKEV